MARIDDRLAEAAGLGPTTASFAKLGTAPDPVDRLSQAAFGEFGEVARPAGTDIEDISTARKVAATGVRIAAPALGVFTAGPVGGFAGGVVGETIAQRIEGRAFSPAEVGVSGAFGAIPLAPIARSAGLGARIAARAAQGAAEGAGGSVALDIARGEDVSPTRAAFGAGLGAVAGSVGGRFEHRAIRGPRAQPAPVAKAPENAAQQAERELQLDLFRRPADVGEEVFTDLGEAGLIPATPGGRPLTNDEFTGRFGAKRIDRVFGDVLTKDERRGLRAVAQANRDIFESQGRGVVPDEVRNAVADALAPKLGQKLLKRGTILNDAQTVAAVEQVAELTHKTQTLAEGFTTAVRKGEATDAMRLELENAQRSLTVAFANLTGSASEQGRALRAMRFLQTGIDPRVRADIVTARKLAKEGGELTADEIAGMLAKARTPEERMQIIRDMSKPNIRERFSAYFKSNLLFRGITNLRNVVSGLSNVPLTFAGRLAAASRDARVAALTGRERRVFAGEVAYLAKGVKTGLPTGMRRAIETIRRGITEEELADPQQLLRTELAPGEAALTFDSRAVNTAFAPFRLASRLLAAGDQFVRTIGEQMQLHSGAYARARRSGIRRGLTGGDLGRFTRERMTELLADLPPDLVDEVGRQKVRLTFQEAPGELAQFLMSARRRAGDSNVAAPMFDFMLPFIKTPANIMRRGMLMTPGVGLTTAPREAARQAGDLAAVARTRLTEQIKGEALLGTMLLAPLAYLAESGNLVGTPPSDPAARARFFESGARPNSLKIGDQWVSLQLFGPLLIPASMVANAHQGWLEAKLRGQNPSTDQIVFDIAKRTGESVLDQSFLQSLNDALKAFEDPGTLGERLAQFTGARAASVLPLSGALSEAAIATDNRVFQPVGAREAFLSRVPGQGDRVTPRVTSTGEIATRSTTAPPFLDISTEREAGVVARELERLEGAGFEAGPSAPSRVQRVQAVPRGERRKREIRFTGQDATPIRQARGREVNRALERLISNPGYERLDDAGKQRALKNARRRANGFVTRRLAGLINQGRPITVENLMP